MKRHNRSDKPDRVPPQSVTLPGQVRERIRHLRHRLQTEKADVYGAGAFVLRTARARGEFQHPRDMQQAGVEADKDRLATRPKALVSPVACTAVQALLAGWARDEVFWADSRSLCPAQRPCRLPAAARGWWPAMRQGVKLQTRRFALQMARRPAQTASG